ncbi:peptidylprolyl isomerase [Alteromonas sp. CYL-A6]|uniref:peptidylprolyl isomerase n=1 Tax=Alteromonas nitratireducens TaxID=3390813 RepID=UPI0034BF06CD
MRLILLVLYLCVLSLPTVAQQNTATSAWLRVPQGNLVYLRVAGGDVVVMLSDAVAPAHVARFKSLATDGFYDQRYFYRVIDGFVAQGGQGESEEGDATPAYPPLAAEFTSPLSAEFVTAEANAVYAPRTGFIDGVAAGTDGKTQWLLHCPGAVAFARSTDKDSATTEFYIVLGQAPHHLDKNMAVIGRVLSGMEYLQALPRGERENGGVLSDMTQRSQIQSARLGTQLPQSAQRQFEVQQASDPDFQARLNRARTLDNPFYVDKSLTPRTVDVCYYQTSVREILENP